MKYEIATLSIRIGAAARVTAGIDAWTKAPDAKGTLLGCWTTDLGPLNQILVLRSFDHDADLDAERWRALHTTDPFAAGEAITEMAFDTYRPFPFMPPVQPGRHGGVYEIRTYRFKHGGVPATIALWQAALPARTALSPLIIALVALDGPPRFTHIWPYADLADRAARRAEAVGTGVWPPKGGPDWLTGDMRSTIALPTPISPLA